jgi:Zn finger protein HypA/HybF involved in hydrogenase expression
MCFPSLTNAVSLGPDLKIALRGDYRHLTTKYPVVSSGLQVTKGLVRGEAKDMTRRTNYQACKACRLTQTLWKGNVLAIARGPVLLRAAIRAARNRTGCDDCGKTDAPANFANVYCPYCLSCASKAA